MKMKGLRRTAAAAAAVALSVGVIAGCGSSSTADTAAGGAETTTAAALSQSEYVTAADAICAKIEAQGDALDTDDAAAFDAALASVEESVAELKALVPPADLQAAHDTLARTSEQSVVLFQRILSGLESGKGLDDASLAADLKDAEALNTEQAAAAKELGLSDCFDPDATTDDNG